MEVQVEYVEEVLFINAETYANKFLDVCWMLYRDEKSLV